MTERPANSGRMVVARRRDLVPASEPQGGGLSQRVQALEERRAQERASQRNEPTTLPPGRNVSRPNRNATGGRGDSEFHPTTLAVDDSPGSPIRGRVVFAILSVVAAALAWAYFGRLASYTSAAGKIQAAGRTKVIEALATGQVVKIRVREGESVEAGATLIELDPTSVVATRTIIMQKLADVRAETLRLRTVIGAARADTIDPNVKIPWDKDVPAAIRTREDGVARAVLAKLAAQIATLVSKKHAAEAERDKYVASIVAQKALVAITQENLAMIEQLLKIGYNSQAKFLDMKAQLDGQQVMQTSYEGSLENAKQSILMIDSEIAKAREVFVTTGTQKISANEQAIVDLSQQLVKANQAVTYMTLRAPVAGIVHALAVTTLSQVVKPGQQLMQIVPRNSPLEIQAYVSNTDIGFIRKGDPAVIKVAAFSYKTYGWVDGVVVDVAGDALALQGKATMQTSSLDGEYKATSSAQKTGNIQFPIIVRANRTTVTVEGKELPLVPGMGVDVEILTENRRAIDYIVSPIEELFSTAGHEHS